jgi:gamma-glutamyl:cysteine ligase YbdK (ATP-grasp superfamily)
MEDDSERDRAFKVAYTQGRRDADVDSHLRDHENRFRAINGSIEKHAENAQALKDSISELSEKVDGVAATLATREALDAARTQQLKDANEKQISNRTFWLGVVTICVMVLVGILAKSHGVL